MALDDLDDDFDFDEFFAEQSGQTVAEYRAEVKLRNYFYDKSQQYIETDSKEWPLITFNWNIDATEQRFSLDSMTLVDFNKFYPEGFLLGYVNLQELDKYLHSFSRRDEGELWKVGCQTKLASLIIYLSENRPIAPPLVKPVEGGLFVFQGGHHRYAIAKEIGIEEIPIHAEPEYKHKINEILNVRWAKA
jgi:hypothetical protein